MEENKNTIFALESLVKQQDGIDEEWPLLRNLAIVLHKRILDISEFRLELEEKEQA